MLHKIEKFLEQFPTNATSWREATDEVRELARASREMLDEYDDIKVEAVDFTATAHQPNGTPGPRGNPSQLRSDAPTHPDTFLREI